LIPGYIISLGSPVVGTFAYYRLFTTRRARTLTLPVGAAVASWTGGYKIRFGGRSGWGNAQLELFDWGVRVSGLWALKLIVPTWEVRYHELRSVQSVRWPVGNQGILLRTDGSAVSLVFVTTRAPQILVQFAMRGVSVEQEVARLKRTDLSI
jgi:hypothetical protein